MTTPIQSPQFTAPRLPPNRVEIMAAGGGVTVSGDVDWATQRESASAAVRYLLEVSRLAEQQAEVPLVAHAPGRPPG
jgi:osmotically-inducible protein OsmY